MMKKIILCSLALLASSINGFCAVRNWQGLVFSSTGIFTLSNSVVQTTVTATNPGATGSLTIQGDTFFPGKILHLFAMGYSSNTLTPTLQVTVKLGSTTVLDSTARTMVGTFSGMPFRLDAYIVCYSTGANGTVRGEGSWLQGVAALPVALREQMPPNATPTVPINTTIQNNLNVVFQWGTASSLNLLRIGTFFVEWLN